MALVCSIQPKKPGPFWTEVLIYLLAVRDNVSLLARIAKNIFPSTFSNEMIRNLWHSWISFPYVWILHLLSFRLLTLHLSFRLPRRVPIAASTGVDTSCRLYMGWHWVRVLNQIYLSFWWLSLLPQILALRSAALSMEALAAGSMRSLTPNMSTGIRICLVHVLFNFFHWGFECVWLFFVQ